MALEPRGPLRLGGRDGRGPGGFVGEGREGARAQKPGAAGVAGAAGAAGAPAGSRRPRVAPAAGAAGAAAAGAAGGAAAGAAAGPPARRALGSSPTVAAGVARPNPNARIDYPRDAYAGGARRIRRTATPHGHDARAGGEDDDGDESRHEAHEPVALALGAARPRRPRARGVPVHALPGEPGRVARSPGRGPELRRA